MRPTKRSSTYSGRLVLVVSRSQAILEIFWGAVSLMFTPRESKWTLSRATRWCVQQSCGGTLTGTPSDDSGVLVAADVEGRHQVCEEV